METLNRLDDCDNNTHTGYLLNVHRARMSLVLQNKLFQIVKCLLMFGLLTKFHSITRLLKLITALSLGNWQKGRIFWKYSQCFTFCRSCTTALQKSFASARWQLSHICVWTTYSITNICCNTAPCMTSFCTVNLTLIRREWGSVQTNPASTNLTCISSGCVAWWIFYNKEITAKLT